MNLFEAKVRWLLSTVNAQMPPQERIERAASGGGMQVHPDPEVTWFSFGVTPTGEPDYLVSIPTELLANDDISIADLPIPELLPECPDSPAELFDGLDNPDPRDDD